MQAASWCEACGTLPRLYRALRKTELGLPGPNGTGRAAGEASRVGREGLGVRFCNPYNP